ATARTGTVRITVVSADETPIAGADVWIHGGGVVRSGATDDHGIVILEGVRGATGSDTDPAEECILVLTGDRPPFFESGASAAHDLRIVLPRGPVVRGT